MTSAFELHPQLALDSALLLQLPLCQVRLMNNACYPWLILVPTRANITEIFDLTLDDQHILQQEISTVAKKLKAKTHCDKINIAALGNMVPQLHIHIIARFRDDADWPKPVWGGANAPYADLERTVKEWSELLHK